MEFSGWRTCFQRLGPVGYCNIRLAAYYRWLNGKRIDEELKYSAIETKWKRYLLLKISFACPLINHTCQTEVVIIKSKPPKSCPLLSLLQYVAVFPLNPPSPPPKSAGINFRPLTPKSSDPHNHNPNINMIALTNSRIFRSSHHRARYGNAATIISITRNTLLFFCLRLHNARDGACSRRAGAVAVDE